MRAPGDAIGLLALECAMDELAEALALDPVELRLRNDTQTDPEQNTAVRLAPSRRSVARGRRPLRLGQARRKAGQRPRRALAGRPRRRLGDPRRRAAERDRACAPGERWPADRRTGDDRHRHRHLHDPHPDCRRDDGAAGRPRHRSSRRHPLIRPPPARAARLERRHPVRRFSPPAGSSRPGLPPA